MDCQTRPRDPSPETMVQLCLVIQEVWDDIPQARSTHLRQFMLRRCRVVHEANGLSQPLLPFLHLTVYCTEQNAAINFWLANDDSRQIVDSTHNNQFLGQFSQSLNFPSKLMCVFFCSLYKHYHCHNWQYHVVLHLLSWLISLSLLVVVVKIQMIVKRQIVHRWGENC